MSEEHWAEKAVEEIRQETFGFGWLPETAPRVVEIIKRHAASRPVNSANVGETSELWIGSFASEPPEHSNEGTIKTGPFKKLLKMVSRGKARLKRGRP